MGSMAFQITSLAIVYSSVYSGADKNNNKKTSKLSVTGLCVGKSPVTGEFSAQRASNAENDSIWWRHHERRPFWSRLSVLGLNLPKLSMLIPRPLITKQWEFS